jgi:hypothetical protein
VPLSDPAAASYLRFVRSGDPSGSYVEIDAPSPAAGTYGSAEAGFGPTAPVEGISGDVVLVDDGTETMNGCEALVGFPAGAIALVRPRRLRVRRQGRLNAQVAGASAVVVFNNAPGAPITMGGTSDGITIPSVMVSLDDGLTIKAGLPATGTVASYPTPENPDRPCHDTGIILGDVNLAGCAGGDGFSVWSMDEADGGSLEDPVVLYSESIEGVTIGHSAAFTWDGEILVFGHEPGGGGQARCQESSPDVDKTLFFYDARSGEEVGQWMVERHAVGDRELHDPQLQRGADRQGLRARQRQLPDGDRGDRLQRPRQREGDRLRRPVAALRGASGDRR